MHYNTHTLGCIACKVSVRLLFHQQPPDDRRKSMSEEAQENIKDLFSKFCNSSTIHGTYFLGESTTGKVARFAWLIVVILGAVGSVIIINNTYEGWKANPIITSVAQLPIESISFLSITVCPLDDTRYVIKTQTSTFNLARALNP